MASERYDFDDLRTIEIPVRYGGRDYLLVEASGGSVARYRDAMMRTAQLNKDGGRMSITGVGGIADAEIVLLASSLQVVADGRGSGQTVPPDALRRWPNRVLEPLIKDLKEISLIDVGEKEEPAVSKGSTTPSPAGPTSPPASDYPSPSV